ncbi:MAG: hypothetical protein FWG18_03285 [Alphaproteobacteria bacterium]|nr:hypothetical protein [Alphaproteobacteria bacterium]
MKLKPRNINESEIDLPLSCSIFLEPALEKYKDCITPVPEDIIKFLHEWNTALVHLARTPKVFSKLGDTGKTLLKDSRFAKECVFHGLNVPTHSFHYAVRFSEGYNFAANKLNNLKKDNEISPIFTDFGAGLMPLAPIIGTNFDSVRSYAIELPAVAELLHMVAREVGVDGKFQIENDISSVESDANNPGVAISLGVLPHMTRAEQLKNLKYINKHFQHFYIEMLISDGEKSLDRKSFDEKTLEDFGIDVKTFYKFVSFGIESKRKYQQQKSLLPNLRKGVVSDKLWFIGR